VHFLKNEEKLKKRREESSEKLKLNIITNLKRNCGVKGKVVPVFN
jgi:hypothetical protein